MAVRNFWIDASIDGRKTILSGGPQSKTGGMKVTIKQRSNGGIKTAFCISCTEWNGKLYTEICQGEEVVATLVTER